MSTFRCINSSPTKLKFHYTLPHLSVFGLIYLGFENRPAAEIALKTAWDYLETHSDVSFLIYNCYW